MRLSGCIAVLVMFTGCAEQAVTPAIDRSAAIEACGAVSAINDWIPNPRAGEEKPFPEWARPPGYVSREPSIIFPSEAELRSRLTIARSRAAASGDAELQRKVDALELVPDHNGWPGFVVDHVLTYCRNSGF